MQERIVRDITAWDAIEDHRTGTQGDARTAEWLADAIRVIHKREACQRFGTEATDVPDFRYRDRRLQEHRDYAWQRKVEQRSTDRGID